MNTGAGCRTHRKILVFKTNGLFNREAKPRVSEAPVVQKLIEYIYSGPRSSKPRPVVPARTLH